MSLLTPLNAPIQIPTDAEITAQIATAIATTGSAVRAAVKRASDDTIRLLAASLFGNGPQGNGLIGPLSAPPVVTPGVAGGATTITNSRLITFDDPVLTYFGSEAGHGPNYPDNSVWIAPDSIQSNTDDTKPHHQGNSFGVEFETDADEFELYIKGNAGRVRLDVVGGDGVELGYDVRMGRVDTASNGSGYLILYDFGTSAFRRIRITMSSNQKFGGIRVGQTYGVFKTSRSLTPVAVWTGDSFPEGTGGGFGGFVHSVSEMLGHLDMKNVAAGSTGFITTTGSPFYRKKIGDRTAKDITSYHPDFIGVWALINDLNRGYTDQAFEDEVRTCFTEIREDNPNAYVLFCIGQNPTGSPYAEVMQKRDRAWAGATGLADLIIDPIGGTIPYTGSPSDYVNRGAVITGTGRSGAPAGNGTADRYTGGLDGTDATHPTPIGHDAITRWIVGEVAADVRARMRALAAG